MIKRISLVARKEGMSPEAFREHWMGPHAAIVRQLKNLRGLQFNPVIDPSTSEWDGIGELWFDSIADAEAAFKAEPVRSLLAEDRPRFLGRNQVYFVTEHTVIAPA
jgi:uncharacterized protein (TIGR02118 family)